ncbi:MAG: hypothetical protein ACRDKG_14600 [Actinomycetota bacterium]
MEAFTGQEGAEMQRQITVQSGTCTSCEELYDAGQSHCACGRPTPYASFEERAAFEVAAWRIHKERSAQTVSV